jgi:hypothetical protein
MIEFFQNITKTHEKPPPHFSSEYNNDKESLSGIKYHYFSSTKEADDDYQKITNKIKINSLIELTSEPLKHEYSEKLFYLNKNLRRLFILSVLIIINCSINLKIFKHSELNISMIILSSLSISIILLLYFNIKTNVLLDIYGYSSFYLFSIFHSFILLSLYILEIINFIIFINRFINKNYCKGQKKYICSKNNIYFLIIFLSLFIFIGMIVQFKYILVSFYQAFNILVLGQKTIFQKQIEINEKGTNDKIEFTDENDNMNSSAYRLNSLNSFKTD